VVLPLRFVAELVDKLPQMQVLSVGGNKFFTESTSRSRSAAERHRRRQRLLFLGLMRRIRKTKCRLACLNPTKANMELPLDQRIRALLEDASEDGNITLDEKIDALELYVVWCDTVGGDHVSRADLPVCWVTQSG